MHFLNPQRGAHLGLTQLNAQMPPKAGGNQAGANQAGANQAKPEEGIGSAQTGYADPENGPFECENCIHYEPDNPQYPKDCDHPEVIADPEVETVDAEGCCNLILPTGEESEEQQEGETGTIPGAGEQI